MRYVWINKGYISKIASTMTGGFYAFLGLIGTFVSLNEILPDTMPVWIRGIISVAILIGIWGCCFVVVSIRLARKKRFKVFSANNGHALYLQYGNIFDPNEVIDSSQRRNIVVPVNRCFDTHVDNHIVSAQTVHGATFSSLYASGKYTEEFLSMAIGKLLENTNYKSLSEEEKPEGNRKRYPVGTVVDLPDTKMNISFYGHSVHLTTNLRHIHQCKSTHWQCRSSLNHAMRNQKASLLSFRWWVQDFPEQRRTSKMS